MNPFASTSIDTSPVFEKPTLDEYAVAVAYDIGSIRPQARAPFMIEVCRLCGSKCWLDDRAQSFVKRASTKEPRGLNSS
jgi:hypothetical protein